jgi:AcrR family transcriptional regulator
MTEVIAAPAPDTSRQAQTRLRLLEAAAHEFAERGFHHATVRDICKRAEANVAAVNYHFGDKEKLYAATLQHWIGVALQNCPPLMGVPEDAPAEERLYGYIRGTLHRMLQTGASGWHGQLMAREMVEPTAAFDHMIEVMIRPMTTLLHGILREICDKNVSDEELHRAGMSIIGQCCFYRHARAVVSRMHGPDMYSPAGIDALARHVTKFSLSGLKSCGKSDSCPPAESPA